MWRERLKLVLQMSFPFEPRPFRKIADELGVSEGQVIDTVARWKEEGKIRSISGLFDPSVLGFRSVLCALETDEPDAVARSLCENPRITHLYLREGHKLNLWFTMWLGGRVKCVDVEGVKVMPAIKKYKLTGVFLSEGVLDGFLSDSPAVRSMSFSSFALRCIRALEEDIKVKPEPFCEVERKYGVDFEKLAQAKRWFESVGILKRYGASFNHVRIGFRANAMCSWRVDDPDGVAKIFSLFPFVSHCYLREVPSSFPYPLFTMVHARDEDELDTFIRKMRYVAKTENFVVLRTVKEYKKSRVKLSELLS